MPISPSATPVGCVLDAVRLGPVRVFGACTRRGGGGVRGFFLAMRAAHSSGNGHPFAEELRDRVAVLDDRAPRQRGQERAPVTARAQTRIEDGDDTAVAVAADEPTESLPQLQHRGWQRVVAEPVAAVPL